MTAKRHIGTIASTTLLTAMFVFAMSGTALAKSLYVIANINADPTPIQAYDIYGTTLVHQITQDVPYFGTGAVAITNNYGSETLFITYESSNTIQLLDAQTFENLGTTTAPGAGDLAGIVFDEGNDLLYAVDRDTSNLYVYTWDPITQVLTLQGQYTLDGARGWGLALDEVNDLLYVSDSDTEIRYYNTADWTLAGTFLVDRLAIGIALDVANGFLYYGAGWNFGQNNYLAQHDLATHLEASVYLGNVVGVMGVAVDEDTSLVYISTGYNDDNLQVYDMSLTQLYASGDIGDPTGICLGSGYNPLNLSKDDGLGPDECFGIRDEFTYTICYDNLFNLYGDVHNATLVDTLPDEFIFVSATDGGTYNAIEHTVSWNLGTLLAGATQECVYVTVQIADTTPHDITLWNSVTIDSDETPQSTQTESTAVCPNVPPVCDADGPYTVECQGATTWVQLDGSGSYDPDGDPIYFDWSTDCPGGAFSNTAAAAPTLTVDSVAPCPMTCNVMLTVDDTWDTDDCATTLTVQDTTPPVVTCPDDVVIECDESTDPAVNPALGTAGATDACDGSPDVTYSDVADLSGCNGTGTITRTWTATDDCNNSNSCDQVITVVDTTAPVITCPPDTSVVLPDPIDPSATGTATATDNCDGSPGIGYSDVESDPVQFCPTITIITRTWTATDACGNPGSCDQLINVTDPIPAGFCCNPADGTLTVIDDGDDCTDDICNEATGEVTHPDNGLCHACCHIYGPWTCDEVLESQCPDAANNFFWGQTCDVDSDGDGVADPCDLCPLDPNKVEPGLCGCGLSDDLWPDCLPPIPTVSEWGLIILALLLMVSGKVYFGYRKSVVE